MELKVDTKKMIEILKSDKPISFGAIDDNGKTTLLCLWALPHLEQELRDFVQSILDREEGVF